MSALRSISAGRSRARSRALAVGLLAGVAGAAVSTAPAALAAPTDPFAALRQCESSGNYRINTGNGFYGAYQFDLSTWRSLGLSGLPSSAAPGTQDAAARRLQALRGWEPWPACSRALGLSGSGRVAPRSVPARRADRSRPIPARQAPGALPYFTVALVGQVRADVADWQRAMVARGWRLTVDGQYGPQSARATHDLEVQQGLEVEAVGVVGPQVRAALARIPVRR